MMSSGPHQTTMGNRELRHVATVDLSVSGHSAGSPSGDVDQSWARISAPIFPPPSRKSVESPPMTFPVTCLNGRLARHLKRQSGPKAVLFREETGRLYKASANEHNPKWPVRRIEFRACRRRI